LGEVINLPTPEYWRKCNSHITFKTSGEIQRFFLDPKLTWWKRVPEEHEGSVRNREGPHYNGSIVQWIGQLPSKQSISVRVALGPHKNKENERRRLL
jgi:hypothetical protein